MPRPRSRPARFCRRAAPGEAVPVRERQRRVHDRLELARIVFEAERRAVRHRGRRDEVPPPQFDRVDPGPARRDLDQPFEQIGRLGPSRAAIGRGPGGVGIGRACRGMDRRNRVDAGIERRRVDRRHSRPRRQMGAEIVVGIHPEPEDAPVPVQRHPGRRPLVARVGIGRHTLAPLGDPFDRPVEPSRGPEHQRVLRKHAALHPEPAAHVARDHRETGLGNAEHRLGQQLADPVRVLAAQMEPVAAVGGVVFPDRAARLHRNRGDPVVVKREPGDMVRRGEGRLRRGAVAHLDGEAPVVRSPRPGRRGIDPCRELLVIDRHQLGGIQRSPRGSPRRRRRPGRRHGVRRRARWPAWARAARDRSRSRRRSRSTVSSPARPPGIPRSSARRARPAPRAWRTRRIAAIRAWAWGERRTTPCAIRGNTRSST